MATTTIDWAAVRQRVELCATTLATRCIALGFQPDGGLLDRARADCTPEAGGEGVIELAERYSVSLDWLMFGDVGALIASAASDHLQRENGHRINTGLSGTRGYWQIQQAAW